MYFPKFNPYVRSAEIPGVRADHARRMRVIRHSSPLTAFQRAVLDYIDEAGGGVVRVGGDAVTEYKVRTDPALAERCYWIVCR